MKTFTIFLPVLLIFCFSSQMHNSFQEKSIDKINMENLKCPDAPSFSEATKNGIPANEKESHSENIDQGWYGKAMENIVKEEYNITYSNELKAYQSPNRKNNIRFIYFKDGFTAETRSAEAGEEEFSIDFKVKNLTRQRIYESAVNGGGIQFSENEIIAKGNTASIENENIRINYTNDNAGMRQDFIVKNKPVGEGKLRLKLAADTKLKMIARADALMFKDENGIDKMKYSSLKVFDANGKELRAYFEKSNDELRVTNFELKNKDVISGKNIHSSLVTRNYFDIIVNDEGAVYPITIDPLSSSPNWTAESNQVSAEFGFSVSTAGDVNGDGYSDVIIGAPSYDNGQTDEGRVFVYHGSASGLSATANWTSERNQASAQFGWSVCTAGDVNGDGYSDVIVGAPLFDNGQSNEGKAFVYYGSASGLSATANWNAEINQADAQFGISVATGSDVNGDGYSDVIVGARFYDNGQTNEGRVYVYHGSASGLSATANWTAESDQANAWFGYSVSTAGDVNGDGYSDIVVGAHLFDNGEADEGRVFVYHGSASGLSLSANWTAESDQAVASFGYCVSAAGDVNGDGYSDVIVGAISFDNGQTDEGKAFVYHGSASGLSATDNWNAESNQSDSQFGISVATAGDVNGDGYSDVIVGARFFDNGQSNEGMVFVYHGAASGLSASANWTEERNQASSSFGTSVSTAGDVNGDGYSDVIIGANFYDNGQSNEGRAFVFHGSASGLSASPNWTAEGNQSDAHFGGSVSTAGDVNGDGYSDVIVGADGYDNGQLNEGRAYVFLGSASGVSSTASWSDEGNQAGAYYGISVSVAGDVNRDGYSDVIVGSLNYSSTSNQGGKVFVYYGSTSGLSPSADWTAEGNQNQQRFGESVSTAGDVNGDGYSDVLVGASWTDNGQTDEGKAFVYHGSASGLSASPNWTAEGNQTNSLFGNSVSCAGDVNGDGYSDIIVGARLYENGQTYEGRAFVYYGSSIGLSASANWTAESDQESAFFGWSVSTAGDVNGDGYSDVIVGANWYDNGQTNEGKAFVYHGSSSGLSLSPDWTAESDQANAEFGYSVSTIGDVNGDGYSDVIVGAPNFSNGQTNEGMAFVYYGNGSTGLRSTVQQYKPWTNIVVSSGGYTGTNGQARLNIFGRIPFGRADGNIVFEYKENGTPFSGTVITNSTSSSGTGAVSDLGISGTELNNDISGLLMSRIYKWRARVQYSLVNNPYQKLGPWKYYNNYNPIPVGNFRARTFSPVSTQLNLTMYIQGFYNAGSNTMTGDTAIIYLRNSISPYATVDSAKAYVNSSGLGVFTFLNSSNGTPYYIKISHRNSIETWSKTPKQFTASILNYDFTTAKTKAFGDNMIQVDSSPLRFAVYIGDVNQDGTIDASDVSSVDNDAYNSVSGYVNTDVTGDNFVDAADVSIVDNNAFNSVSLITP